MITITEPLPECGICERPTKREAFDKNGGICTRCWAAYRGMTVVEGAGEGVSDDVTVWGGRFLPPVPERDR